MPWTGWRYELEMAFLLFTKSLLQSGLQQAFSSQLQRKVNPGGFCSLYWMLGKVNPRIIKPFQFFFMCIY